MRGHEAFCYTTHAQLIGLVDSRAQQLLLLASTAHATGMSPRPSQSSQSHDLGSLVDRSSQAGLRMLCLFDSVPAAAQERFPPSSAGLSMTAPHLRQVAG